MLRFYAVISILLAASLSFTMLVSQQLGKLSNAPQFAYVGTCQNGSEIYLSDYMHRITIALTRDLASKNRLTWSPNGALLAYGVYGTSPGLHVITETGQVRRLTDEWEMEIVWIDNSHILVVRDISEETFSTTYIINIETLEMQIAQEARSYSYAIDLLTDQNGEVGIFQWNFQRGGTDDLYITDVETPFTIRERYTFDGSDCYELNPQFRPSGE